MRREFSENDLKTLYQAFLGGMKKRQVMELMGYTEVEHDEAFHQARIKFSRPVVLPKVKPQVNLIKHQPVVFEPPKPFKRPPSEYSNRSPMGIARPGLSK